MSTDVLSEMRQELQSLVDIPTKNGFQRYFKERVVAYGVRTALVNRTAIKYFKLVKPLGKEAILNLCEELFKSDVSEDAFIAAEWAYRVRSDYQPEDFMLFERWIAQYINNWAKCDSFCNHAVGSFIEMYPQYLAGLKKWAKSENRWVRRASAVTLIIPARRGKFLDDIFAIADSLLEDKDDLVQKGYGWMLKEASKPHLQEVFNYIMRNKKLMPRTALRYAIEKMPDNLKRQAMAK